MNRLLLHKQPHSKTGYSDKIGSKWDIAKHKLGKKIQPSYDGGLEQFQA